MENKAGMKAVPESFAVSAYSAVNKIKPRRTRSPQRFMGNSVSMGTLTKSFAFLANSAVN